MNKKPKDFLACNCETKFTVEPQGEKFIVYLGRFNHRHGYNLFTVSDVAANCDLKGLIDALNFERPDDEDSS